MSLLRTSATGTSVLYYSDAVISVYFGGRAKVKEAHRITLTISSRLIVQTVQYARDRVPKSNNELKIKRT